MIPDPISMFALVMRDRFLAARRTEVDDVSIDGEITIFVLNLGGGDLDPEIEEIYQTLEEALRVEGLNADAALPYLEIDIGGGLNLRMGYPEVCQSAFVTPNRYARDLGPAFAAADGPYEPSCSTHMNSTQNPGLIPIPEVLLYCSSMSKMFNVPDGETLVVKLKEYEESLTSPEMLEYFTTSIPMIQPDGSKYDGLAHLRSELDLVDRALQYIEQNNLAEAWNDGVPQFKF